MNRGLRLQIPLGLASGPLNTPAVSPLLETLAAELERPRPVTTQVIKHLVETYSLERDAIGRFLVNELVGLEDYQIDLALSPLFTPTLKDQSVFAELLGRDTVPREQWPTLVHQLTARPARAQLLTEDGKTWSVPLREVTIERFVDRLRLEGSVSESLFQLVNHQFPAADHPMLKAVARRSVWEDEGRRDILLRFFTSEASRDDYRLNDVLELLRLVEAYEPKDVTDLVARIPHWQRVAEQQISDAASPRPFFNERVQELHGGGRDQRRQDKPRIVTKENELAFLARLQRALAS